MTVVNGVILFDVFFFNPFLFIIFSSFECRIAAMLLQYPDNKFTGAHGHCFFLKFGPEGICPPGLAIQESFKAELLCNSPELYFTARRSFKRSLGVLSVPSNFTPSHCSSGL